MKHESTSKLTAQFEAISEYLLFSLYFIILLYMRNKREMRLTHFLIVFVCLYSIAG